MITYIGEQYGVETYEVCQGGDVWYFDFDAETYRRDYPNVS